jgi:cytosine/uracil/thiamine/allantoin permease
LFVSNFLDTLNNILELTVAFLGPALAIYAVDIALRGNRYDGPELHDETPASTFWYWHGVRPAGAIAMVVGTAAALLCADNSLYVSPVSGALSGADLSAFVGPVVGACVYAAIVAWERRRSAAAAAAPAPAIRPAVSGVGAE